MSMFRRLAPILLGLGAASGAHASDHLDTPTVIADPRADIGDLYGWMSPDGRQLNLAMTIVGRAFSDRLDYVFHVDSGPYFGKTPETTTIQCRFPAAGAACSVDGRDVAGDPGVRIFTGLRDDPFFNNVRGTRAAYEIAATATRNGSAPADAAGCPAFSKATSVELLDAWRHTNGGEAANFLAGWKVAAIVVSIDLDRVAKGGRTLAVWAATVAQSRQIDRAARPLTGNALLGTVAPDEVSDAMKEDFNAATPADAARFTDEIARNLALYDGFDGTCGNAMLVDRKAAPARRYHRMAALLADDRLWINAAATTCKQLFAVELAALAGRRELGSDCGGRTLTSDAVNVYRSLLVDGSNDGVDDGLHRDDADQSDTVFPFLAAPAADDAASQK